MIEAGASFNTSTMYLSELIDVCIMDITGAGVYLDTITRRVLASLSAIRVPIV
jgi:hypothetical protein